MENLFATQMNVSKARRKIVQLNFIFKFVFVSFLILIFCMLHLQEHALHEMQENMTCLMRVAWAAAVGKLHLTTSTQDLSLTSRPSGSSTHRHSSTGA